MPLDTRLPLLAGQFKPITYQAPSQANMLAEVAQAASAMQGLQRNAMAMREAEQERTASAGVAEIIRKAQGQQLSPDMLDQMADALAGMPKFLGKSAEMKQAAAQMRSMRAALGQTTVEPLAGMGGAAGASADAAQQRYGQVNLLPLLSLGAEGQQAANLLLKQNELRLGARPPADPEDVRKARAFGFDLTPEGYGSMLAAGRAQPAPQADPDVIRSMRALEFPMNPEGFAAYQAATRTPQAAPQDTELVRNLKALGLPLNAEGVATFEASKRAPATLPNTAPIPESVNLGNRVAIIDKNPNSPTFNQELRSMEVGAKPEPVKPPSTAPEPKQVQLGDRVATIDNNPNSPTFGKELGSLQMGAGPMTQAQVEANRLADARLALETARVNNDRAGVQQAERRLRILEQEATQRADPAFQARMAAAQAAGTATGRAQVEKASQANEIAGVISELEQAVKPGGLIDRSTGSGAGALADVAAGFVGIGTPGAVAIGRLQPIADMVLKIVPRFEGPQSDKDTASYKEAAGKLADPATPNNIRRAAANEILRILRDRKGKLGSSVVSFDSAAAAPAAPAAAQGAPAAPRAPAAPATTPAQGNRREISPGVFVTERP
jgi:hypothetical protein